MASRNKPWHHVDHAMLPGPAPRWIAVYDMLSRLIDHRPIPPGMDVPGELVRMLAAQVEAGFTLESFSSQRSSVYCHRGTERREISVVLNDPTKPLPPQHANSTGPNGTRSVR